MSQVCCIDSSRAGNRFFRGLFQQFPIRNEPTEALAGIIETPPIETMLPPPANRARRACEQSGTRPGIGELPCRGFVVPGFAVNSKNQDSESPAHKSGPLKFLRRRDLQECPRLRFRLPRYLRVQDRPADCACLRRRRAYPLQSRLPPTAAKTVKCSKSIPAREKSSPKAQRPA